MRAKFAALAVPVIAAVMILSSLTTTHALEEDRGKGPFEPLLGWWQGTGRLFMKGGKHEPVKCRATYRWNDEEAKLLQSVRCATAGGKVEVKSEIGHVGSELSGTWKELIYELSGDLTGKINDAGFKVSVSGATLKANMDVMVKGTKQIIEIQFHENSTLLGMTIVADRGKSR